MSINAQTVKLIVMGSGGVGKSALTVNYVQHIFLEKYDPTIEDSYRKLAEVNGQQVYLEILDTAGTDQFTAMRDFYMKTGDGFLICYSTVALNTFNDVPSLVDQILRIKDVESASQVPMVLIGTKVDLANERVVTTEMGRALASKLGSDFLEVSTKARVNVDEAFAKVCEMVLEKKKLIDGNNGAKRANKKANKCSIL